MPLRTIKPQLAVAWAKPLEKLEYPVIAEPKLDGVRCVCIIDSDGVPSFWSRDEKLFVNFEELEHQIRNLTQMSSLKDMFFDGEIMATSGNFDDTISRSRSHRGKNTHIPYVYNIFDVGFFNPTKPVMPLRERKELLSHWFGIGLGLIKIVPRAYCNDATELLEYHKKNCRNGYEGTMVKPMDSLYYHGRNKDWKKIKPFLSADLKIVSMSEGKGKASNMMGRMVVEGVIEDNDNQLVRCEVGTGFTDELRKELWNNQDKYIGKVVEIQYQEVTKDNSLRFPSFKRFRNDKL